MVRWGAIMLRVTIMVAMCGLATYLLGKDTNLDIFNYHLYVAHAFWTHQDLQSDFMAASMQRYLNPVGYLPFYWMIQAGWHSLTISLILAAFHSVALVMLWEICERHLFKADPRRTLLSAMSVGLGAMSPVFLGTLGGAFLDPVTMVLVFGGILLLCEALDRTSTVLPLFAGTLLGIAAGIKLTNLIFIAGAGVATVVASRQWSMGWRTGACFGIGAACGALLSGGWWSLQLYREFGNPFFPLFNDIFGSPDFPAVKLQLARFKPASIADALAFPFDMASSRMWVYAENGAADIRFALLIVFGLLLVVIRLPRKIRTKFENARVKNHSTKLISFFFIFSFALWVWTSGNGRYGEPLLLLVAPMLVLTVRSAIPNEKIFVALMLVILAAQGVVIALSENLRWESGAWTGKWIDVNLPEKLASTPYGYLTEGITSYSFVALHLHPESKFINLIGAFPIALDGPGGHRVGTFISAHAGKLRMMGKLDIPIDSVRVGSAAFKEYLKEIDARYALWDLQIDTTNCDLIGFSVGAPSKDESLFTCLLLPGNPRRASMIAEWERASAVFDRIENFCPVLFNPRGAYTTKRGLAWYRLYLNTEIRLRALNGRVKFSRDPFGPFSVDMGTLKEWETGTAKWSCVSLQPHWKLPAEPLLSPTLFDHSP